MELEGFLFFLFKKVAFIESASSTKIFYRNAIADVLLVYNEKIWILSKFHNTSKMLNKFLKYLYFIRFIFKVKLLEISSLDCLPMMQ